MTFCWSQPLIFIYFIYMQKHRSPFLYLFQKVNNYQILLKYWQAEDIICKHELCPLIKFLYWIQYVMDPIILRIYLILNKLECLKLARPLCSTCNREMSLRKELSSFCGYVFILRNVVVLFCKSSSCLWLVNFIETLTGRRYHFQKGHMPLNNIFTLDLIYDVV